MQHHVQHHVLNSTPRRASRPSSAAFPRSQLQPLMPSAVCLKSQVSTGAPAELKGCRHSLSLRDLFRCRSCLAMGCAASKSTAVSMAPAKSDDGPGREFASATDKPLRSRRFLAAHFLHSPAELATTCPPKPARCRAIPEAGGKTPPRAEGAATSRGGTTPATDSLTSLETASSHSRHNSAVGLDKMIDEKRGAKNMSERVVHIEVRQSPF